MKIDDRFRALKDTAPPDLWEDIVHREPRAAPAPSRAARYVAAALALAVAAGGVALAVRAFSGRDDPRPADTTEQPTAVRTVGPGEAVTLEFEGLERMSAVVADFGSVWVTDWLEPRLFRVDPASGELLATIPVSTTPYSAWGGGGLAVGDGSVWIVNAVRFGGGRDKAALLRVAPEVNAEVEAIPLDGDLAGDVDFGHGAIWVTVLPVKEQSGKLLRLDPRTYEVLARIALDRSASLEDILVAGGAVWIPEYGEESGTVVTRIDPRTNTVTGRVQMGASAEFAVFEDELWALTEDGFIRIDPANAMSGPEPVPVDGEPVGGHVGPRRSSQVAFSNIAPGAGGLWFVQSDEGRLVVSRFNPATEEIDASVDLPVNSSPAAMAVADGAIWVVDPGPWLHRIPLPPGLDG